MGNWRRKMIQYIQCISMYQCYTYIYIYIHHISLLNINIHDIWWGLEEWYTQSFLLQCISSATRSQWQPGWKKSQQTSKSEKVSMNFCDAISHLLNYNTQVWIPKIECHTQAASGCFHLIKHAHFQMLARHQQTSKLKTRIRFRRLRLGLQHLHVRLHLSNLGSSKFI